MSGREKPDPKVVADLWRLQRGRCACGCKRSLAKGFEVDHINPVVLDGPNVRRNYQLLRTRCNQEKGGLDPLTFYRKRGFIC